MEKIKDVPFGLVPVKEVLSKNSIQLLHAHLMDKIQIRLTSAHIQMVATLSRLKQTVKIQLPHLMIYITQ
jgi:hypothetical protein